MAAVNSSVPVFFKVPKLSGIYDFHYCSEGIPSLIHIFIYCKVANTNKSQLEAHPCFFRLLIKGKFDAYACEKVGFLIIKTHINAHNFTVLLFLLMTSVMLIWFMQIFSRQGSQRLHCTANILTVKNTTFRGVMFPMHF